MLKILFEKDLRDMLEIDEGSTSVIYLLNDNMVYKKYNYPQPLFGMDHINFVPKLYALQHLANLSNIEGETFVKPKGFVTDGKYILGITMDYAEGGKLKNQSLLLRDVIPHEAQVREDILEISKKFVMFDLNSGSIFFSPEKGFQLVDLDYYDYATDDISTEQRKNLMAFYTRVIRIMYKELIGELVAHSFRSKPMDYINFEYAQEIIDKYLQRTGLKEEDIKRKLVKKGNNN